MNESKKKAVLITGSSNGIGRTITLKLIRQGYHVFAGLRKMEVGLALQKEAPADITPVLLDITIPNQIKGAAELVEKTLGENGGLAGIINNAGVVYAVGPSELLPVDAFRQQYEINVLGTVAVTQAFLPLVRKGEGRVIIVGSAGGMLAMPFIGPYHASKFALEALADVFRRELRPWHIHVSLVQPGLIDTDIWVKGQEISMKFQATLPAQTRLLYEQRLANGWKFMLREFHKYAAPPEIVADVVCNAMNARRPKSRYPVGPRARIARLSKFIPDRISDWITQKVLDHG